MAFTQGIVPWHNHRVETTRTSAPEMRLLIQRAQFEPDPDEREKAKRLLREITAAWRGFPGQRRRGEPPHGVEIR